MECLIGRVVAPVKSPRDAYGGTLLVSEAWPGQSKAIASAIPVCCRAFETYWHRAVAGHFSICKSSIVQLRRLLSLGSSIHEPLHVQHRPRAAMLPLNDRAISEWWYF